MFSFGPSALKLLVTLLVLWTCSFAVREEKWPTPKKSRGRLGCHIFWIYNSSVS